MEETGRVVASAERVRARLQSFRALRHRNFRLLWIGLAVSSLVMPMQWLVQTWLILELTHSSIYLGILGAVRGLPMLLFGLWGGVLADRVDRRRLLIITQCAAMALVTLLAMFIILGQVQVWQVFLMTFLTGAVQSFDQPTRTALVPDLVPGEDLPNAVALAAMARQSGTALGPAGAGFLIEGIGLGPSYLLLAGGSAFIVLMLLLMRLPPRPTGAVVRHSMVHNLVQGLAFARRHPILPGVLLTLFVFSGLGIASFSTLNPLIIKDIWRGSAILQGWMFTCFGVGSFLGSFALASVGERWPRGRLLLTAPVVLGILMTIYGQVPWQFALVVMVGIGGAMAFAQVTSTTLTQLHTPHELQGRVVSLLMLEMALGQAGGIASGAVAKAIGPLATVSLMGSVILGLSGVMAAGFPRLRRAR